MPPLLVRVVGNMFGDQKTMREIIREQKRMVDRAARALERDRMNLEREEKKLIGDIKKNAKENRIVRHLSSTPTLPPHPSLTPPH